MAREVFLENIPKRISKFNKSNIVIDWENSEGIKVPFIYDDISGVLTISKVDLTDKKHIYVYVNYRDVSNFRIAVSSLKKCNLGSLLNKRHKTFKYKVGDIVKLKSCNVKIIETFKKKDNRNNYRQWYKYICLNCNNIHCISSDNINKGYSCPFCCPTPQKVKKGYNDISTINHEMVKYFVKKEDTYKYSHCSNRKVEMKCPICGHEKNLRISHLYKYGFVCDVCCKNKSFGEHYLSVLLNKLNIKFITEYCPKWIKRKRYDFYLPYYNCIIEVHGEQHYKETRGKFSRTLQEEQENDKYKKDVAIANGISNYITLDCSKSSVNFISNSILNSEIKSMLHINEKILGSLNI